MNIENGVKGKKIPMNRGEAMLRLIDMTKARLERARTEMKDAEIGSLPASRGNSIKMVPDWDVKQYPTALAACTRLQEKAGIYDKILAAMLDAGIWTADGSEPAKTVVNNWKAPSTPSPDGLLLCDIGRFE